MKLKAGNKIYTTDDCPIMVVLTEKDKENIINMHPDATMYAEFNDNSLMTVDEKYEWMDIPDGTLDAQGGES